MASWLRELTWFQRIALALLVVAIGAWVVRLIIGGGSGVPAVLLTGFIALTAFRARILWRVRNRLLFTFFLFGVVPLYLIYALLYMSGILILGQFASERVRHDLEFRIESLHAIAQDLTQAAAHGASTALLEGIRGREPRLAAVVRNDKTALALGRGDSSTASDWLAPEFKGMFESHGSYYLGAKAHTQKVETFAYLPLDDAMLATFTGGAVAVVRIIDGDTNTNVGIDGSGARIAINKDGAREPVTSPRVPPAKNSWDVTIAMLLPQKAQTEAGKTDDSYLIGLSRPSALLKGVLTGRTASIAISLMIIIGGFFLVIEIASLVSSIRLTRGITRSVADLHEGTLYVAKGDFAHQIPVRGKHQLSELAASFNSMSGKIQHYIGEMKKKEKIESELEIARQVQARLFPRAVPELKTLEMTGMCIPGRFVSGDYYDFVKLDDRYTAIALGDVSGKGVSAALLMASIQSALHAQLKFSGPALDPSLSTATLMGLISQQLYENTPAEKYATFFCSVYDDETGLLRYTNCGHLKPILVRQGEVSALEGDGMVVGLLPKVSYDQREFQLQTGDLLAIFSDGIPEAENASAQEFGEARLGELLAKDAGESLEKIMRIVTDAVKDWAADPDARDDTTLVLLRRR